jgi:hypothetical protein
MEPHGQARVTSSDATGYGQRRPWRKPWSPVPQDLR